VFNTISIYGGMNSLLSRPNLDGISARCPIVYTQFATTEEAGLRVPCAKMIPDGVSLNSMNFVRRDVKQYALSTEHFQGSHDVR